MAVLLDILFLLLTAGSIVLVVVLISVLLRMKRFLEQTSRDLAAFSAEALPTLQQIQQTAAHADDALGVITENRETVARATENLRKVTENIYRLENTLQQQIEPSVVGIAQRLAGLRRGIETFIEAWRKSH